MGQVNRPLRMLLIAALPAVVMHLFQVQAQGWEEIPGGRWRELPRPEGNQPGFVQKAPAETGVLFTNTLSDFQGGTNRTLYNGSGVAAGDIDGDELPDIVLTGINHPLAIFRNLGAWRFTNVTHSSGVQLQQFQGRGAALVDITGDGPLDLLLAGHAAGVRAFRNDGKGQFTEFTKEAGIASSDATVTMAFADVDDNGTIDLYAANNRSEDIRDHGQVQLRLVGGKPQVPPALRNRLVLQDGRLEEYGEPDRLFLNMGDGRFKEALFTEHFRDPEGNKLASAPLDWALSATFRDLNFDGAPDLYVCNDFWTPDRIWLNNGKGQFTAASPLDFRQISGSSMGVDMADLNNDGHPEIFVVDMLSRWPSWRKRQMSAQPNTPNLPGVITNQPQILRNTLFLAREDGTYAEIAHYAGLEAAEWAWQPLFMDVDLDADMDLLITTGHAHDVQDRDAEMLIRSRQKNYSAIKDPVERKRIFSADLRAHMGLYPPLHTPIVAFRNDGSLNFTDATEQWGTTQPGIHHGIATADFDADGDLDFVVNKLNAPAALYENVATAPRIALRLKGKAPNTSAVGAVVTVSGGGLSKQIQEMVAGGRYLSSGDTLLVFAAHPNTPMRAEIRWPDDSARTIQDLRANRIYEILQAPGDSVPASRPDKKTSPPLFEDVSSLLAHTHTEMLYDDFLRQPLLPWRLSQLGPGVTWTDLDGDGWDDLFIGTGAAGRLGAFRNNRKGGFEPFGPPFQQPLPRDTTALVNIPSSSGKPSLVVGLASYEDGSTNAASLMQFIPGGPAPRALWPDLSSSIGPIAPADFDGDGDLDLFIGARVTPARWPEAGPSLLLRRENQSWVPDSATSQVLSSSNSVSAAIWTDLNNDGFAELITAGEWSPLRIFKNSRGALSPLEIQVRQPGGTDSKPLASFTGLWTSLAAADFDGDGRIDLVAGNWGENSPVDASPERPLTLVAGPWSGSPSLSLLETVYDPAARTLTPVRPLDELASSFPFLVGRFNSFRQFSDASVSQLLGERQKEAREYHAATLQTSLFLNRGDHLELRTLPPEAQFAPVFGIVPADFNGDGFQDLFLAQNFFATRPGLSRLDAGRGLLLQGNGKGGFAPLTGSDSGIKIYGEQRGAAAADYDQDGRTDLVVTQNGAATQLLRNRRATPGIRIRLQGPPGNPSAFGAAFRISSNGWISPLHEVHATSGYWSSSSPHLVLHLPPGLEPKSALAEVRWPGGKTTRHPIDLSSPSIRISISDP